MILECVAGNGPEPCREGKTRTILGRESKNLEEDLLRQLLYRSRVPYSGSDVSRDGETKLDVDFTEGPALALLKCSNKMWGHAHERSQRPKAGTNTFEALTISSTFVANPFLTTLVSPS